MTRTFIAAILLGFCLSPMAHADNSQQNRMTECNKQASGKTGEERKTFMSSCLSGKTASTPQQRMKDCNQQAEGKKGEERKAFMSTCLKKN